MTLGSTDIKTRRRTIVAKHFKGLGNLLDGADERTVISVPAIEGQTVLTAETADEWLDR